MNIKLKHGSLILMLVISALLLSVTAIAQSNDSVRRELFAEIEQSINSAEDQDVELFSPSNYKLAIKYYDKALDAYKNEKSLRTIRKYVEQAQDYINTALETISISKITLTDLIELRKSAISYEIDKAVPKSFASAEKKFKAASSKVEKGSTKSAKAAARGAEKSYRSAVMNVLQKDYLKDARSQLKAVKKDIFKDVYKSSLNALKETEAYLKYQAKTDFVIEEIFPEVHGQISEALALAGIKYNDLVIDGKTISSTKVKPEKMVSKKSDEKVESKKSKKEQAEKIYNELPQLSNAITEHHAQITRLMSPSTRKNIAASVSKFEVNAFGADNEQALTKAAAETVQQLFEKKKLGSANIDDASFLVINAALIELDEDIKIIIDETDEMEIAQAEIRDFKTELSEYDQASPAKNVILSGDQKDFAYKCPVNWKKTPNLGLEYISTPQIKLRRFSKIEKDELSSEIIALDNLTKELDNISEIVDIKLKSALKRRAKYIAAMESYRP